MRKNAKVEPSCFAIATEFSLRSDGRWLTVGGNNFDVLRTDDLLEAADWMRARTALKFGLSLYFRSELVMRKMPGSTSVELYRPELAELE